MPRPPLRPGFKSGLAVGVVLVSAVRGCAFDVAQIAGSLNDPRPASQVASAATAPVLDEPASRAAIPTANVYALPRAAVPVEDLPRSRTH